MRKIILALALFAPFHVHSSLVSQDLGSAAYTASETWQTFTPDLAFDGDLTTNWNAGDWTTPRGSEVQWIEVDLGQSFDIAKINLVLAQVPDGYTEHEIWLSSSAIGTNTSGASLAKTLEGITSHQQVLMAALTSPISAQFVQIRTIVSPSWIAWYEVQVIATPVPAAVWLFGTALIGLVGFSKQRKAA